MRKPVDIRRIVALIAAYLVALQALLLPLSVAAGVAVDPSLCITASSADVPQPIHHDTGCPCAAGCGMQCGQALIAPPQVVVTFAMTDARAIMPARIIEAVVRPVAKGPQIPRAPPAA